MSILNLMNNIDIKKALSELNKELKFVHASDTIYTLGGAALYLLSDLSKGVTGQIMFVDSGYNIMAV